MENRIATKPKQKKYTGWLIIIICLITLSTVVVKWHWLRAFYAITVDNPFHPGDNMYANFKVIKTNSLNNAIIMFRMIRPLTAPEIDDLKISAKDKDALKEKLKLNPQPYVLFCGKLFTYDMSVDNNSALIGKYLSSAILKGLDIKAKPIDAPFFEIAPIKNMLKTGIVKMPPNYTWADQKMYVVSENATNIKHS